MGVITKTSLNAGVYYYDENTQSYSLSLLTLADFLLKFVTFVLQL